MKLDTLAETSAHPDSRAAVPGRVRTASNTLAAVGLFSALFGLATIPAGLFVGPHILIAGLAQILVGLTAIWFSTRLFNRRPAARLFALTFSWLVTAAALSGGISAVVAEGTDGIGAAISFVGVACAGVVILICLHSRESRDWFAVLPVCTP